MKKNEKAKVLGQEEIPSLDTFRKIAYNELIEYLHKNAIELVQSVIEEEVKHLCGRAFSHKSEGQCHRAGSDSGSIYVQGQRVPIKKPRVRRDKKEVHLETYKNLRNMENLDEKILELLSSGVSTRKYEDVLEKFSEECGLSKSSVSRRFILQSRKKLDEFRNRKFIDKTFMGLFLDGTRIGSQSVIVALGVDVEGNKHFLGFSEGSTENYEVTKELLSSLLDRGITFTENIVCVLDGSKALRKAIQELFGNRAIIQRCKLHKLWNILSKLPEKDHNKFKVMYDKIFYCDNYDDARSELKSVISHLSNISYSAKISLEEAEDELITLHRINMPVAMRKSFFTTNIIESGFSGPKSLMRRVKKWNTKTDMISRWVSVNLLYQEKSFRKINGVEDMQKFLKTFSTKKLETNMPA